MANLAAKKIMNQATVSQHSDETSTEAVLPPVQIVPETQRTQLAQPQPQQQHRYNLRSTTADSEEKKAVELLVSRNIP